MVWDIFDEMRRMQEEMDRMFNEFFMYPPRQLAPGRAVETREERKPSLRKAFADVQETDKGIIITAELPGMEREDIELNITSDRVEIRAQKKEEKKEENQGYRAYVSYAGFYRNVPLPVAVNPDNVKATYRNGVLEVTLPKKEASKSRSIKVE